LTKRFPNTQQFGHHFAAGVVQIMAGFQRATDDEKEFKGRFTFVVHRGPFRVVLWFQQKQHGGDEIIGLAFEYAHPWDGVAVNETHGFNPQLGGQIPQHCKRKGATTQKKKDQPTTKQQKKITVLKTYNKTTKRVRSVIQMKLELSSIQTNTTRGTLTGVFIEGGFVFQIIFKIIQHLHRQLAGDPLFPQIISNFLQQIRR
jgi:hypothetical protein